MALQNFKYNINHYISILPKAQTTEWVAEQLEKEGINTRTFFRDKSYISTDEGDIPGERLLIYAKFFGVDLIDLFNYKKKVKSAYEREGIRSKIKSGLHS